MNHALPLVALLALSFQDAPASPWGGDAKAAREEALRDGRPCVLLIHADASAH